MGEKRTVVEFDGCYWHACTLCRTPKENRSFNRIYQNRHVVLTGEQIRFIDECKNAVFRKRGMKCIRMKECQWKRVYTQNDPVREYIEKIKLEEKKDPLLTDIEHPYATTQECILTALANKSMFGIIICDIHVPDSKKHYFQEFAPIIKHANLNFEDIGRYMQEVATVKGIKVKDRRCVIDSYFGEHIGLIDEYLMWLLEKGLIVTKIHQI